jgi:hypothetical protein
MKADRGSRCIAALFLYPRREMRVGDYPHASAALPTGNRPGTHCIEGGGRGPGPVWTVAKNLYTGVRSPDRPARIESLYWLEPSRPTEARNLRVKYNIIGNYFCEGACTKLPQNLEVGFVALTHLKPVSQAHLLLAVKLTCNLIVQCKLRHSWLVNLLSLA